MFVLGVTGGLGAGKTTASRYFVSRGADLLDADTIAKELLATGAPGYEPILERFGRDLLDEEGRIQTSRLAAAAFASSDATGDLDAILHPLVTTEIERRLDDLAARAVPPAVVVVDVPLLAEAPAIRGLLDYVLLITAPEGQRLARALQRGMLEGDARNRMDRQVPDEERRRVADEEIVNASDEGAFRRALADFWEREVEPRVS